MRKACDDSGVKSTSTESISVWPSRAPAETRDGDEVVEHAGRIVGSEVDEHEPARAGAGQGALGDPGDERGRDAGVDGVPSVGQHPRARLRGEPVACSNRASHGPRLLGPQSNLTPVNRASPLVREATLSAAGAGALAAVLIWLGPPGSDLAAHAYQRTLFLDHGFTLWNNFWYAGRYSFVTYSVLYYPLAALFGIRLLAVATVAIGVARLRRRALARVGPGHSLVEPHVRRRLGRDRPLGGVPVRARRGARAARAVGAAGAAGAGASPCWPRSRSPRARSRSCS